MDHGKNKRRFLWLVCLTPVFVLLFSLNHRNSSSNVSIQNPAATVPAVQTSAALAQADFGASNDAKDSEYSASSSENSYEAFTFGEFDQWIAKYEKAESADARVNLLNEGQMLAVMRRQVLEQLIETNPEAALKRALPVLQRQKLPAEISQHLEKRVSGRGAYSVAVTFPLPGQGAPKTTRSVTMNGETYRAYTYGRRLNQTSKENIPLHGIAIGDTIAVHESPIRLLEAGEMPDPAKTVANPDGKCPVKGVVSRAVIADAGDVVYYTCCSTCPQELSSQLISAESGNGPSTASSPDVAASSWTEGAKTVIFIRVDFPDAPGEPVTQADALNLINNTVNNFYKDCSYNKTSMTCTATSQVLRLPQNSTYYASNFGALVNDSRTAANNAGYNDSSYNLDVIGCKYLNNGAAGQGYVGARGCVLYGYFDLRVAAHELGHNYGVWHANYWSTTDGTTIGTGSNEEYGDPYTVMGFGDNSGLLHFNEQMKSAFNWLTSTQVTNVTASGTYRIYAHDQALGANIGAFKVARTNDTSNRVYWCGFRQKITGNQWLMNGLELRWAPWGSSNGGPQVLDTTPGSSSGKNDTAIWIGKTFSDPAGQVFITPIGKGGTTPESIDVVVKKGDFSTDNPPSISSITCNPGSPAPGSAATLTCNASDPDGDALAFFWDFGDGSYSTTSSATQSKSWPSANSYTVTCTVSDMKGKTATQSITVTVSVAGTYAVSGNITSSGTGLAGVTVTDGSRTATTDSAGNYSIANVPNGTYTLTPSKAGYSFTPTTQSVTVNNANVTGKNFTATTVTPPPNGPGTGITREWWLGIGGTAVSDLTSNPAYPNSPSGTETVTTLFESPTNWNDNYGQRMRGYYIAPVTGNYFFYIASDDNGELWLSTDNTVANKRLIASVPGWTNSRAWTTYPNQKSAAIALTAGQRYYIEALMKEGGGGDNLAVGVEYPNGAQELPMPFHRTDPWVTQPPPATKLTFTTQPSSANAGAAISPAVQVAVQDANGNTVTSANNSITLAIGTNPGGGTLSGTLTVSAVNGVATFSSLSINQPGIGYTLTASAANLTGTTSAAFNIVSLRIPENPANAVNGIDYKYYEGSWSALPNFDALSAVKSGVLTNFSLAPRNIETNFGFKYSGYVDIPADGTYTFYTTSDDGSKLYIGTTQVVNNDGLHGMAEASGSIGLKAGKHAISVVFFQAGGGYGLEVRYAGPTVAKTLVPDTALYRINNAPTVSLTSPANGSTFTAPANVTLTATAADSDGTIAKVEFLNGNSLVGTVTASPYTMTWSNVAAGSYTLTARATDNNGAQTTSAAVSITVAASLRNPENPANTVQGLDYSYYEGSWSVLPGFDALTPIKTGTINNFSLTPRNSDTNIGFKFSGYISVPTDGIYNFYTTSDDGSKLFIGTTEVVNNDGSHGMQERSGQIGLKAGKHAISVTFFQGGGPFGLEVRYDGPGIAKTLIPDTSLFRINTSNGTGLTAEYYDNSDFTGLKFVRTDATVNFDWGSGSPDPAIGTDTFSVRWTGQVQPIYNETYTFYTVSDDGVRLWVNGQLVINNWTDHAPTENSGTIALSAGQKYSIKMEFYENGGGATAKLSWSSASESKKIIPQSQLYPGVFVGTGTGLSGQYFDNMDFTALKVTRIDPTVNFNWGGGSPDATVGADTFSARWTGTIQSQFSETYTLYTQSDDGIRLWINGQLVIDNWTDHAPTENSGTFTMVAGVRYDVRLDFYENGGGAMAVLLWSSPSTAKQVVPQTQLYPPSAPTPPQNTNNTTATTTSTPGDSDGDGLLDDFELAMGLNPTSADSDGNGITDDKELISGGSMTYLDYQQIWLAQQSNRGGAATAPNPLKVTRLSGGLHFNVSKHDTLALSGDLLSLPDGFKPSGNALSVDVSGIQAVFTLDAKGRGKAASGTVMLKGTKFAIKLRGGSWSGLLAESGVNPAQSVTGGKLNLSVSVNLAAVPYQSDVTPPYSSRAGVGARFKN